MRHAQNFIIVVLTIITVNAQATRAQTCTQDGRYQVQTEQQLTNALCCVASGCTNCSPSGCITCNSACPTEIVVPTGTNINITDTIEIGSAHSGLVLTINGSLTWTGPTGANQLFISVEDTSSITIHGSGVITSNNPNWGALEISAVGIRVENVDGITIEGLTLHHLNDGIKVEGAVSSNIELTDLTGHHFRSYGVFIGITPMQTAEITNCHFSHSLSTLFDSTATT